MNLNSPSARKAWKYLPLIGSLWIVSIGSQAVLAQDEDDEAELGLSFGEKATVSIATGGQQLLARAPSVASVITAEEIRDLGAKDLDEVLVKVPGLHVSKSEYMSSSQYLIRGMTSTYNPQVLMLMNGIPMTSLFLGNRTDFGTSLPVENISRIEVIRGPGSALYGADAFSGVINIITKNAKEIDGTRYGIGVGSFNTRNAWVQYGGKLGEIEVASYLRAGRTDGQHSTIREDAQTVSDRRLGTTASLAPGSINEGYSAVDGQVDLSYGNWRLRLGYRLRDDVETGVGVAGALDPNGRAKSERFTSDLVWRETQIAPEWDVTAQISFMDQANTVINPLQLLPPGALGSIPGLCSGLCYPNGMLGAPSKWERAWRSSASAAYTGWQDHRLRFGIGHDVQEIYRVSESKNFVMSLVPAIGAFPVPTGSYASVSTTGSFLSTGSRRVNYVFIQDEWSFARDWTLTAGLRHDKYSDFGGTTNPRIALVWDAAQDITVKMMAGRAFRAPAWAELYNINNPVALGNPSLKPETINTVEAAISWQVQADLQVNANIFQYQWNDIIRFVPNTTANTGATAANSGKQHGQGLELDATWDVTRALRLIGSISVQHSIDEATHQDAGLAPHQRYFLQATWRPIPLWVIDANINHVMDRKRQPGDTRAALPDYTTVGLTARRERMFGNWELRAAVSNLFDEDVREPSLWQSAQGANIPYDLPMPGRNWYLQLVHDL